ncbi:PTS sugar transporter subunit IIB [Alkalihalobacillus sp. 1P02AB]|uniref:PTS sugar transporter subunit IIB n=1 Tax=Alkalihalobacillus sp. 1P02AB TaxID=3132260 RepID=UPI0039A71DA0
MRVLLICSAGMSSSILASKMQKAASDVNISLSIISTSEAEYPNHLENTDFILIGPQIRYLEESIRKKAADYTVKVAIMDTYAFSMMDGQKLVEQVLKTS